jgi:hypothetical protein
VRREEPRFDLHVGDATGAWSLYKKGTSTLFASGKWAVERFDAIDQASYEFSFRSHIRGSAVIAGGSRLAASQALSQLLATFADSHGTDLRISARTTYKG